VKRLCKDWSSKVYYKAPRLGSMGFVSIVFLENRQGSSLALRYTTQKGFLIMFTLMYEDLQRMNLLEVIIGLLLLLMISQDEYGCT